jgi:hypothetical protein
MYRIQTITKRLVDPFEMKIEDIELLDIAHSLAFQCRYNGHCDRFYSVAQHCINCQNVFEYLRPKSKSLWPLMHDASEAYLTDLPAPIKRHPDFEKYVEHENNILKLVGKKFKLGKEPDILKFIDRLMLSYEFQNMMIGPPDVYFDLGFESVVDIAEWNPCKAKDLFLSKFRIRREA